MMDYSKSNVLTGEVQAQLGDDFDIDLAIGVENIKGGDQGYLQSVCMKDIDPGFRSRVKPGDFIVGGRNFGYGHPHYPAMATLRSLGVSAILAESFSPGFWRGETHNGFPLISVPGISRAVRLGDRIRLNWPKSEVLIARTGAKLQGEPLSPHTVDVIRVGGAFNLISKQFVN